MEEPLQLIQIATYTGLQHMEAELLRARLEAAGIICYVTGLNAFSEADRVRLKVRESDSAAAQAILRDFERKPAVTPRTRSARRNDLEIRSLLLGVFVCYGLTWLLGFIWPVFGEIAVKVAILLLTVIASYLVLNAVDNDVLIDRYRHSNRTACHFDRAKRCGEICGKGAARSQHPPHRRTPPTSNRKS